MLLSAIIPFLGSSVFRMLWGEVSSFVTKRQEHSQEIERLRLQGELDAAQHGRNMESIRLQSELGVKEIRVKGEVAMDQVELDAWKGAVDSVGRMTGLTFIDYWNQGIRPFLATMSIVLVVLQVLHAGGVLDDWTRELASAILGLYVADRSLVKRGK
jgi:hypothetical protein